MRYQMILRTAAWIGVLQLAAHVGFGAVNFTRVDAGDIGTDAQHSQSLAWGDYDGDGWVDLLVGFNTFKTASEPYRLYHNNGDGTFTRVLDGGIADDMDPSYAIGAAWADFENDGDLDLFVAQCENLAAVSTNRLYLNNGDGTFVRAGLDWIQEDFNVDVAWVDIDLDGLLDLTLTGYYQVLMYHHQPDGSMVYNKISDIYDKFFSTFNWSDYDNDNYPDLFISGGDFIYHNNGDRSFTPAPQALVTQTTSPVLGDYDNDGDKDLLKGHFKGDNIQLLNNTGDGVWTAVDQAFATAEEAGFRPASWADYDNDGYLDLFIPNSSHSGLLYNGKPLEDPNLLFHNNGDGTFTRVTEGPLVNDLGMSFAAGWADYDNDGDLDVVLSDGQNLANQAGQFPAVPVALYRNDGGNDNNWINLTLVGTVSNRSAIGAKVFATATINGVTMTQMREVGSGQGGYSQCDTRVHFGLGDATMVDELRIEWPLGIVQVLTDVEANQFHEVTESRMNYGPWEVGLDGWCDTTPWMGWLMVSADPWVWSASLGEYIYSPGDSIGEGGAWVYILRNQQPNR